MTKCGFIGAGNLDLDQPTVRIIQHSFLAMEESWNSPNRNAPFWRFYWNPTPGAEIHFKGNRIKLQKENVILIPPHINYASRSLCRFTQLYMHFEWDAPFSPGVPMIFSSAPMMKLLGSAEKWFGKDEESFVVRMHTILFYYLSELLEEAEKLSFSSIDPRIAEAITLMNADLSLNNREIARKINMSCDNFQRVFRRNMGTTVCQYRLSRRMEAAQQLLRNRDLLLDEISVRTGFANRYQFSKSFKLFFGIPPRRRKKV